MMTGSAICSRASVTRRERSAEPGVISNAAPTPRHRPKVGGYNSERSVVTLQPGLRIGPYDVTHSLSMKESTRP